MRLGYCLLYGSVASPFVVKVVSISIRIDLKSSWQASKYFFIVIGRSSACSAPY